MKKPIKIQIELGAYAHCLWESQTKSFMSEFPGRFTLLEGPKFKTVEMFFCSTYIEAKATESYLRAKYKCKTALYNDEQNESFVVCTNKITDKRLHGKRERK